jgi:acetylornithine deacetylase
MRIHAVVWSYLGVALALQDGVSSDTSTSASHPPKRFLPTYDLIGLHKNLTSIESISGNEEAVGKWLVDSLNSQGYHTIMQPFYEKGGKEALKRFNVVARPDGDHHGLDFKVLLTSHIDTVRSALTIVTLEKGLTPTGPALLSI